MAALCAGVAGWPVRLGVWRCRLRRRHVRMVINEREVPYEMATSGVYAFNAQRVVAEGIGWDIFTLVVAVPVVVRAFWWPADRLVVACSRPGLLGYFYQYLAYAVTWAFGPLFHLWRLPSIAGLLACLDPGAPQSGANR